MPSNKWLDRTQPQTLVSATMLMYINAALSLVFGGLLGGSIYGLIALVAIAGEVAGGWGIANEKKWGYWLAVVVAVLLLAETVVNFSAGLIITLLFEIVLVALLLHPQSREYRRIWFR